jgi:methionine-gamma-lyase
MKNRGFSTRAIHGRGLPDAPGKPVVQPIVTATTFSFEDAETFGRVMSEEEYGFLYSRLRNPTVEELNGVLADLESAEAAQAFASGMAAISAALMTNLRPGDTLLCARQLYGATYALAEQRLKPLGVEVIHLDVTDHEAWRQPARVRYVETMSNPGLPVADLEAIAATKGDGIMIVDNTFASPALCRPLELGADIVCESATKYLNGHHDVTAGVLAGSVGALARARAWQIDTGAVLDAFAAYLLRRGLKTLALRMDRHCVNALAVARFLEGHGRTERVYYAGLESYPQHELAKRQLAGFGGMLAVELAGGREAGEAFMNNLELCKRATSLGGVDTVVSHPASTSHRQFSEEQLAGAGITPGLLRVSVGCEDADDIVADFGNALERL